MPTPLFTDHGGREAARIADIRGLVTAGRAVRLERVRVSRIERRAQASNPVAA